MGIISDFIRGEFIDVIEWTDDSRDTLSYRFPDDDKAIISDIFEIYAVKTVSRSLNSSFYPFSKDGFPPVIEIHSESCQHDSKNQYKIQCPTPFSFPLAF